MRSAYPSHHEDILGSPGTALPDEPATEFQQEGVTPRQVAVFRRIIYRYYDDHARELPWRSTQDPYRILVSEIMLQQTQVERVLVKYDEFLRKFPDFSTLAHADFRDVLRVWKGLGYNRRALSLQAIALSVVSEFGGRLPDSPETLRTFPGIGPATAGALGAFAFHRPTVFMETNIRRVFLHLFFPDRSGVRDTEILPLVEKTLDTDRVRTWYYALMDYGAMLKRTTANPNQRSAHHRRQAPFADSDREIRGLILKALLDRDALTDRELLKVVGRQKDRTRVLVDVLVKEGLLERQGDMITISPGTKGAPHPEDDR
ncbi:MAG: A/G-specific adenine glycosylase [Desulfomonilaceae bacterium]|nr:A/G-specific adenine glycosylase [Desulfomonilaceae bacterium]